MRGPFLHVRKRFSTHSVVLPADPFCKFRIDSIASQKQLGHANFEYFCRIFVIVQPSRHICFAFRFISALDEVEQRLRLIARQKRYAVHRIFEMEVRNILRRREDIRMGIAVWIRFVKYRVFIKDVDRLDKPESNL